MATTIAMNFVIASIIDTLGEGHSINIFSELTKYGPNFEDIKRAFPDGRLCNNIGDGLEHFNGE